MFYSQAELQTLIAGIDELIQKFQKIKNKQVLNNQISDDFKDALSNLVPDLQPLFDLKEKLKRTSLENQDYFELN